MSDITKFTLELEGHPDEVHRVWAAMVNAISEVEREGYERVRAIHREFGLHGPLSSHGGFSTLLGKITVSNADLRAVIRR